MKSIVLPGSAGGFVVAGGRDVDTARVTCGAVVKLRARGSADRVDHDIIGERPADQLVVTEHGVPFEVHPHGGLNHGLFTDMREQRRGLGRFVAGARVLNLFSYTAALSVAC